MSGDLIYRVNTLCPSYNSSDWADDITPAIIFAEFLTFINSHPNFDFAGYGTGASQTGTTPPSSWWTWDYRVGSVPFGDNSWFVINATKASKDMDGSGDYQWQAKFQVTLSSGFDDCSGSDYSFEGNTYTICCRSSADGGWNSGTCDFAPTSGADISDNYRVEYGANYDLAIDIVGNNDTIFWRGMGLENDFDLDYCRQGYLGIINRRTGVDKPFFMMVGAISEDYGGDGTDIARNAAYETVAGYNWRPERTFDWPTYSIGPDGTTKITSHWKGSQYSWTYGTRSSPYQYGGYNLFWRVPIQEYQGTDYYNYLGELDLVIQTDNTIGESVVLNVSSSDENESGCYLQFCARGGDWAGMAMKYPAGVNNLW